MSQRAKRWSGIGLAVAVIGGAAGVLWIQADDEAPAGEVLLAGDSIMNQTAERLRRQVGEGTVRNEAVNGSGLLTPHLVDWPARLRMLVDQHQFDRIVLLFVGNYTNTSFWETTDGHVIRDKTDPRFFIAWEKVARRLTEVAAESGAEVFWVLPPPMRSDRNEAVVDQLRTIYSDIAADHAGVEPIDTNEVLASDNGRYLAEARADDETSHALRAADGVHLAPHGAQRLADLIADRISRADEGRGPAGTRPANERAGT